MAEVQVKHDTDNYFRQLQHLMELFFRWLMRVLPPALRSVASKFYKRHIEGIKAVQKDGPTKEMEGASNLSYEEVIDILEKCQRDGIQAFAYEFKKGYAVDEDGNKITNDDLGKRQSISKMEEITKANRQITKYRQRQARFPKLFNRINEQQIQKWENRREKAIQRHEGYRYNIVFNKSRIGYMSDRLAEIKSKRLGITKDEFYTEHPEAKEVVERAIDQGLDLNIEELGDWAKEFVNEGDTDISNFKDDYFTHTISLEDHTKIYNELNDKAIPYGVELNKGGSNLKGDTVKLYINAKDFEEYRKLGTLDKGVLQSFGKKDNSTKIYNITRKEEKETKDIVLPRSSMDHYIDLFKGKDFTMNLNGRSDKTFIVSMTLDDAKEVLDYEKKRDKVQEKLDEIHHEKELETLEDQINKIEDADKIKSGDVSKNKNSINKGNIDKVPTLVSYDTLSSEVKTNLKAAYNLSNDEEAREYFDNRKLELGINKYNSKLGVLITETDKEKEEEKQYFVYNDEQAINNVVDPAKVKNNKNEKSNNTDSKTDNKEQPMPDEESIDDNEMELNMDEE